MEELGVGFASLPLELLLSILSQRCLRPADLLALQAVSRAWRNLLADEPGSLAYELCRQVKVPISALQCLSSMNRWARVDCPSLRRLPMCLFFLTLRDRRQGGMGEVPASYGRNGPILYWGAMDKDGMPDGIGLMMVIPKDCGIHRPAITHHVDKLPPLCRSTTKRGRRWMRTHGPPMGNWYVGRWRHGKLEEGLTSSATYGLMCIERHPSFAPYGAYVCESAIERACYTGQVKHGTYHGHGLWEAVHSHAGSIGCRRKPCGCRYLGAWKKGSVASGCLSYRAGLVYQGTFNADQFNGEGWLRLPCGAYYAGEWLDGVPHGRGILEDSSLPPPSCEASPAPTSSPSSSSSRGGGGPYDPLAVDQPDAPRGRYEGQFDHGQRTGQGTQLYADGSRYEGQWRDNRPQGQGTKTHADGTRTLCVWDEGKPHGKVVVIGSDGRERKAYWIKGERCSRLICKHYLKTGKRRSKASVTASIIVNALSSGGGGTY